MPLHVRRQKGSPNLQNWAFLVLFKMKFVILKLIYWINYRQNLVKRHQPWHVTCYNVSPSWWNMSCATYMSRPLRRSLPIQVERELNHSYGETASLPLSPYEWNQKSATHMTRLTMCSSSPYGWFRPPVWAEKLCHPNLCLNSWSKLLIK